MDVFMLVFMMIGMDSFIVRIIGKELYKFICLGYEVLFYFYDGFNYYFFF